MITLIELTLFNATDETQRYVTYYQCLVDILERKMPILLSKKCGFIYRERNNKQIDKVTSLINPIASTLSVSFF